MTTSVQVHVSQPHPHPGSSSIVQSSSISVTNNTDDDHDHHQHAQQQHRKGCSFSRQWLIHLAQETLQIVKDGRYTAPNGTVVYIQDDFLYSLHHSIHYHSSHVFPSKPSPPLSTTTPPRYYYATEFHVCWGSSLQVAHNLQQELVKANNHSNSNNHNHNHDFHIGILNSASGTKPEKFLRGTLSQEEGICRATCLYPCLAQYKHREHYFYNVNAKPKYQESSSSCAIFCPKVPVIREDSVEGTLLDTPQYVSIVNIPAPNAFVLRNDGDDHNHGPETDNKATVPMAQTPDAADRNESYDKMTIGVAMRDRIHRALSIFAEHQCTDLVLCAFGCGVHGNNPQMIAQVFHTLLTSPDEFQGRFRVVTFAIQPSRHSNYEAFCQTFGTQ
jgi:uncharacterized protein (TIGR02452 family)